MVCVSFCVICIVELLVSSVICRFQGLSYLHVPDCIQVFFYFVNSSHYSSYFDFCTKCNILDINLLWNMNFVDHLLFYMKLLNYLYCDMFGSVLECYEFCFYPSPISINISIYVYNALRLTPEIWFWAMTFASFQIVINKYFAIVSPRCQLISNCDVMSPWITWQNNRLMISRSAIFSREYLLQTALCNQ